MFKYQKGLQHWRKVLDRLIFDCLIWLSKENFKTWGSVFKHSESFFYFYSYMEKCNNVIYFPDGVSDACCTCPPAHSGLLHPPCSPWTSRLWLRTSSCSPGLQGLRHEEVVDGDRKREVSRDVEPLQQQLKSFSDMFVVMQTGVHGEEQTPARPAEGAEVRDRIFEAGGAAAATAAATSQPVQPSQWGQRIRAGPPLHNSQQRMYGFFMLRSHQMQKDMFISLMPQRLAGGATIKCFYCDCHKEQCNQ